LQNPTNQSHRQVDAYNTQQREKAAARREARAPVVDTGYAGKGKRVVRRMDNGRFRVSLVGHPRIEPIGVIVENLIAI
jgi:hypothetical protein